MKQVADLDLRLLRSFSEIVDRGGFAGAQSTLNISQSVLSEHLKTLEIRLGFTLCKRGPGGFKLMPEGEEVYRAAKQLFSAVDTFKSDIAEIGEEMTGDLVVAVEDDVISNPACKLPAAIQKFTAEVGRKVRFRIENMVGYQAMSRVADGTAHVGISVSDVRARDVFSLRLFDETLHLYCAAGHPLFTKADADIDAQQIAEQPYSSRGHLELKDLAMTSPWGRNGDVGLGGQAQLALVLSGRDVGYLPDHIVAPHVAAGAIRAIAPELTRRVIPVNVVARDSGPMIKLIARLRACLVATHSSAG
ncbi:LysR family transcriptional regulator [Variovorax paradoxus]|jgi:DNA-binding transcriptional LysR family regulator|uniref:LysR family transcriptional regulator n=1 Tax=Variovorax paradoxus TaxID=34073 RepID=UPI00041D8CCB